MHCPPAQCWPDNSIPPLVEPDCQRLKLGHCHSNSAVRRPVDTEPCCCTAEERRPADKSEKQNERKKEMGLDARPQTHATLKRLTAVTVFTYGTFLGSTPKRISTLGNEVTRFWCSIGVTPKQEVTPFPFNYGRGVNRSILVLEYYEKGFYNQQHQQRNQQHQHHQQRNQQHHQHQHHNQ